MWRAAAFFRATPHGHAFTVPEPTSLFTTPSRDSSMRVGCSVERQADACHWTFFPAAAGRCGGACVETQQHASSLALERAHFRFACQKTFIFLLLSVVFYTCWRGMTRLTGLRTGGRCVVRPLPCVRVLPTARLRHTTVCGVALPGVATRSSLFCRNGFGYLSPPRRLHGQAAPR